MEKIESSKSGAEIDALPIENEGGGFGANLKSKISDLSNWMFGLTKFLLGVLLLPFVFSSTVSFLNELNIIEKSLQVYFWNGVLSLVIVHLLIWEPAVIYSRGHKILEFVFSYIRPLVKVAPYLLPIYAIVVFLIYLVLSIFIKSADLLNYTIFLLGFSCAMHLVFSAKTLRSKKNDFLKGNYIFGFAFVYMVNLIILAFFFNLTFDKFSFVNFSNQSFLTAKGIFNSLIKQLFL